MSNICENNDLLVFSHLRWNYAFQRPQHLMTRFAKHRRVFFFEEPLFENVSFPKIHTHQSDEGVFVVTPYLPQDFAKINHQAVLATLVDELLIARHIHGYTSWYYTPMPLIFTRHLTPKRVLFDVTTELSIFKNTPAILKELETELFEKADLVFTSGRALYSAIRDHHHNVHAVPNSIDKTHFAQARIKQPDREDQAKIPHPRVGFSGVIDDRTDIKLLAEMAHLRPDLHFVMIGPVVKLDPSILPQAKNIHYLGQKTYREIPFYIAGWDCAMMPFALNESTRYISPTETPEFLAAGRPVVSTAIEDIIHPYADENLVYIAATAQQFVDYIELALLDRRNVKWQLKVDSFLAEISWDMTWQKMAALETQLNAQLNIQVALVNETEETYAHTEDIRPAYY